MASFADMMRKARKRNREDRAATTARFKEILKIVRKHDLKEGLTPEKTVDLIKDLGTTFIKLGQIASTHPDVLPVEYCEALGSLRTKANPMDIETVRQQIETELGHPIEELFASFDEKAVGSASVAQVHRAELQDGTVVAVKVQRPGVVEQVTNDLAIMERVVELYDLVSKGESLSVKDLVDELVRTSTEELDFNNEAANLERFYANNSDREKVTSPKCYRDLSTSAILTEDFVSSPCAEDIEDLGFTEEQREEIAYLIANNYMQQIMVDGFYHADPHAGNVLIAEDGSIEWIDFGMMGSMTSSQRESLSKIITSLVKGDAYGLKRAVMRVAIPKGAVDHAVLLEACEDIIDQFINVDLESFDTGALLGSLTTSIQNCGFDIDPFLVNLGRGLTTLEGTIHLISPKLNIMNVLTQYLVSSFDPNTIKKQTQKLIGQTAESAAAMATLPSKASDTLDMIQKGHAKFNINFTADDKLSGEFRRIGALIALALIAMALIIGFCILGASTNAPVIGGVSIPGGIGLICGILIAIYVFVKSRKYLK